MGYLNDKQKTKNLLENKSASYIEWFISEYCSPHRTLFSLKKIGFTPNLKTAQEELDKAVIEDLLCPISHSD